MNGPDEMRISQAGGDGELSDAIATIKDQQAKLDRITEMAHWAGKRGWTIHPAEIRTALEAS